MSDALSLEDHAFLHRAARILERPSGLVRAADWLGKPIAFGLGLLPMRARESIASATQRALRAALGLAVTSLPRELPAPAGLAEQDRRARWSRRGHVLATAGTGALGGSAGWTGLAAELPVSTTLMLRSIAAIAREFGEDLQDPAVRLECLTVFAHGGRTRADDEMDASYLALRAGLADSVHRGAVFVAAHGARELQEAVAKGSAPALVQLLGRIASRFELVVSDKALAQGLPLLGAIGGAAVTAAFADWFNSVARAHFGMRRLEREHGQALVEAAYRSAAGLPGAGPEQHLVLSSTVMDDTAPRRRAHEPA